MPREILWGFPVLIIIGIASTPYFVGLEPNRSGRSRRRWIFYGRFACALLLAAYLAALAVPVVEERPFYWAMWGNLVLAVALKAWDRWETARNHLSN